MPQDIAIDISDVSKCFKLYEQPADRLKDLLLPMPTRSHHFWALKNITATIRPGETVGLVGRNGSGKSTLLQLIVGTLTPTQGTLHTHGRIAALLELGSGFNPEFTGRQNVFFNGRILGLSQREIEQRFDQIAAFADIGPMLEQPVKAYSSGMFVRLAFAVVINIDPDILIVDEALAVGDIYFQQKCFARIRALRERGVTILFVSHDAATMFKLCDRALLLEQGELVLDDAPKPVLDLYEANMLRQVSAPIASVPAKQLPIEPPPAPSTAQATASQTYARLKHAPQTVSTEDQVQVQFVRVLDLDNQDIATITSGDRIQIAIGILCRQPLADPHIGFKLRNRQGEVVFETNTHCMGHTLGAMAANQAIDVRFQIETPLADGQYSVSIGVANQAIGLGQFQQTLLYAHDLALITVLRNPADMIWAGMTHLKPQLKIHLSRPS